MKSISTLVLACLISAPSLAQTLPDEINHAPYEARYQALSSQVTRAEAEHRQTSSDLAEVRRYVREMNSYLANLQDQILRRESEIPYITHPFMVALNLARYNFSDTVIAAALVHDVLEDTDYGPVKLKEALGEELPRGRP